MQTNASSSISSLRTGSLAKGTRSATRLLAVGLGVVTLSAAAYAVCPVNKDQKYKDFSGQNLSGCSLEGFNVYSALFSLANLTGTSFKGASGPANFNGNESTGQRTAMTGSIFYGATFPGSQFVFTNLESANFYGANVSGSSFNKAKLAHAVFYGANVSRARLEDVPTSTGIQAIGADFGNVVANRAKLPNMTAWGSDWGVAAINQTDFSGSYLQNADFGRAMGSGSIWKGATLEGTNFNNAFLKNADFDGANIGGAHFEGTNLDGANLCNTARNPRPSKNSDTSQVGTRCPI